jgi:hypothetical protein
MLKVVSGKEECSRVTDSAESIAHSVKKAGDLLPAIRNSKLLTRNTQPVTRNP